MLDRRRWFAALGSLTAGLLLFPARAGAWRFRRKRCQPQLPCSPCVPSTQETLLSTTGVIHITSVDPPDPTSRPFTVNGTWSIPAYGGYAQVQCTIDYPGANPPIASVSSGKFTAQGRTTWYWKFDNANATQTNPALKAVVTATLYDDLGNPAQGLNSDQLLLTIQ